MSEQTSPSITFMLQYTEANAQYVDYTNRDEAVELDNDIVLDQTTQAVEGLSESQIAAIKESVPEQGLDFKNYINYMNRSYATEKQSEEVTAIFNQDTNYLASDQVADLKSNLNEAYKHGSLLWQGVISFDNAFLAKEGLYDVETGKVDQQAIKNVVREAMPNLINQEGLDSSAFWWGNIHLNTDNVHVHFGLSEKNSGRERFFYEPRGRWEYRGNFSQKTIKQLKSQVLNGLLNEQTKEQHLRQEQILANLKTNLIQDVFKPEKITQSAEKNFLEQAFNHLPQDKNWRYGSNARDFAVSKFFLDKYIDSYLANDGKEDYEAWQAETREFLKFYQDNYTSSEGKEYEAFRKVNGEVQRRNTTSQGFQLEKFFQKREQELRDRLGNRILREFKKEAPRIATETLKANLDSFSERNQARILRQLPTASLLKTAEAWRYQGYEIPKNTQAISVLRPVYESYDKYGNGQGKPTHFESHNYYDIGQVKQSLAEKKLTVKELDVLGKDDLGRLIDAASKKDHRSEKETKELGLFRYALRLRGYQEEQASLLVTQRLLGQIEPTRNNQDYLTFKQQEIQERLELTKLALTPSYKLTDQDRQRKEYLANTYAKSRQFPLDKATREEIDKPVSQLKKELALVKRTHDPELIRIASGQDMDKKAYQEHLETHLAVFETKHRIHSNNEAMKQTTDEQLKKTYRQENGRYFKELMGYYDKLANKPASPSAEKQRPELQRVVAHQLEQKKVQKHSQLQSSQGFRATSQFMSGLSKSLKSAARQEERAYRNKHRSDDREEEESFNR